MVAVVVIGALVVVVVVGGVAVLMVRRGRIGSARTRGRVVRMFGAVVSMEIVVIMAVAVVV